MKEDGTLAQEVKFVSNKKSVSVRRKENRRDKDQVEKRTADDPMFRKFRRENYFETLSAIAESKKKKELEQEKKENKINNPNSFEDNDFDDEGNEDY